MTPVSSGRFARVVRLAACSYCATGVAVACIAFLLAPWGLLLLIVALGAFASAALLALMAVGFAEIERAES